jgi:dUTP pyrophosphatase
MLLKIKKLHNDSKIPVYSTSHSAGADLFTTEEVKIQPGEIVFIKTGLAFEIPEGYFGMVTPRSSLCLKKYLMMPNTPAIIDADFRGDLTLAFRNLGDEDVVIEAFEKIAQIIFVKYDKAEFVESEELSETVRGSGNFGSTGKF